MRKLKTALLLSLILSIVATGSFARAAMVKKDVEYFLAGRPFVGYLAYDDAQKGPRPAVLIAHNWMGITQETKDKADQVAALGYVAFAVDVYGKGSRPKDVAEAKELAGYFKKDRVAMRARMQQGLSVLEKQPGVDKSKLAAIGYCFGGTAAIELARAGAPVKGVVSFHGGLDSPKPEDGKRIKGKVLALHGADDPFVAAKDLAAFEEEMKNSKVDMTLIKYEGAVHSFTEKGAGNDKAKGAAYNADADRKSWIAMQNFFNKIF